MADSQPVVASLEGTTTVDDKMTFEPERLGYMAATDLATFVAKHIRPRIAGRIVVIANEALLADLANLASATLQLEMLAHDYDDVAALKTPIVGTAAQPVPATALMLAPMAALTAGLQGALGLVSLFRQNVEFRGVSTKVDARAFEIALAARLVGEGALKVFVPDLLVGTHIQKGPGTLGERWTAVAQARHGAWQTAGPSIAALVRKDADLDLAIKKAAPAATVAALEDELLRLRRDVEPLSETLGRADRQLSELQQRWEAVNEATGLTMLARMLRAEALHGFNPIYLHTAVVASGGHNRISRNLLRMIFFGDGLSSVGGCVVRWALLDSDGSIADGGIRAGRRGARFPIDLLDEWQ